MELHHDKHHAAYVKGANTALEQLHEARGRARLRDDLDAREEPGLQRVGPRPALACSGPTSRPTAAASPTGELAERSTTTFGGFDAFKAQMTEAAGTVQGSGWALASWEPVAQRIVVQQVYDHQGNHGQGTMPLLAIDAWEHAYYLQYKNVKADFFEAVWNVVNWSDMAARYENARQADLMPIH